MGLIRLLTAPFRRLVNFSLFQLLVVIAIIVVLQAQDDNTIGGEIFSGLDRLVGESVNLAASAFSVKTFTRSWLTFGLMIAYVYLVYLLALALARRGIRKTADLAGRHNVLWLRDAIAHERGVEAYRAWEPLEKIRPAGVPQDAWEQRFAWPADNRPPYPNVAVRVLYEVASFVLVVLLVAALLQAFTPVPALSWLGAAVRGTLGWLLPFEPSNP
jgi:hypothetical protein